MPQAIPIVMAAGSIASTGYSIYRSEKNASEMEKAEKKQEKAQKRLLAEARDRERIDGLEGERDAKRAVQRSNQFSAQSANKGGTASPAPSGGSASATPLPDALGTMYSARGGMNGLLGR